MREILFKGKRFDNGEWVKGLLGSKRTILVESPLGNMDEVVILPETVCQYAGLTDADGSPIFEGDMFEPDDDEFDKSVVEFRNGAFRVVTYGTIGAMMPYGWDETEGGYGELDEHDLIDWIDCGVIGNIHDNPELMDAEV